MTLLSIFIALLFLYSLVSGRLERTSLTAPIVFTLAGMLALLFLPELRDREGSPAVFLLSVPFLLFFMGLAGAGAGGDSPGLARFIVEQPGGGVLIGIRKSFYLIARKKSGGLLIFKPL